jgi:hypothetical protein
MLIHYKLKYKVLLKGEKKGRSVKIEMCVDSLCTYFPKIVSTVEGNVRLQNRYNTYRCIGRPS